MLETILVAQVVLVVLVVLSLLGRVTSHTMGGSFMSCPLLRPW